MPKRLLLLVALCAVLVGCAPILPQPQPPSPLFVPQARHAAYLPLVAVEGWTRKCKALDTWAGDVAAQIATLPEGGCGHIWWSPDPLPEGMWSACRSVEECAGLLRRTRAGGGLGPVVLLLNEPNNPDTAGGGWPVSPERAALELRPVVEALRAAGVAAACCGVYMDSLDSLDGAGWMEAYRKAGGALDVTHYHVFGRTAAEARRIMRRAEAEFAGPLVVSEAGWCESVKRAVEAVDTPRVLAVFTLARKHCE